MSVYHLLTTDGSPLCVFISKLEGIFRNLHSSKIKRKLPWLLSDSKTQTECKLLFRYFLVTILDTFEKKKKKTIVRRSFACEN